MFCVLYVRIRKAYDFVFTCLNIHKNEYKINLMPRKTRWPVNYCRLMPLNLSKYLETTCSKVKIE